MATVKTQQVHGACVWRISERAPMGEWIDLSRGAQHMPPEVNGGGWVVSSFDLLRGADIIEDDEADTIPSELLDQLYAPSGRAPRSISAKPVIPPAPQEDGE